MCIFVTQKGRGVMQIATGRLKDPFYEIFFMDASIRTLMKNEIVGLTTLEWRCMVTHLRHLKAQLFTSQILLPNIKFGTIN